MERRIWVVGEGVLADHVLQELGINFSMIRKSIQNLLEESTDDVPQAILSFFDYRNIEKELEVQRIARKRNLPYFRAHLYTDRAFIGPWVFPKREGCIRCAEYRMRMAHPHREKDHAMVQAQTSERYLKADKGWSIPFLFLCSSLIEVALQQLVSEEPFQFVDQMYVGYDHSLIGQLHTFQPNSGCPDCSKIPDDSPDLWKLDLAPRPKPDPRTYRLPNPHLSREKMRNQFYDWRMGMFKHVYRDIYSSILPICGAELPLNDGSVERGFGRTTTFNDSELTAMLEALERYAGMLPRGKRTVVRGSYHQLQDRAIHPPALGIHDPQQASEPGYNYCPYDDDTNFNWVWAYSWNKKEPILIPEQMVYYRSTDPKERFVYETSNGCAMGGSLEEAIFYALLEVIERDAFLVAWYNRLPLVHLDIEDVKDPNILLVKDRVTAMGYQLHFFDMTMDSGIPSIWATLINPAADAGVKTYSAAGAHPDPEKALMGAMVEVVTSMPIYEQTMPQLRDQATAMLKDSGQVQTMEDHVLLYSHPDTLKRFDFLLTDKSVTRGMREVYRDWYEKSPPEDLTEELKALMEKILENSTDIFIVDETTPELQKVGIHAVKVFVQGMLTMSFGHQYRRIVLDRVKKAPILAGYRTQPIAEEDINLDPHPFP